MFRFFLLYKPLKDTYMLQNVLNHPFKTKVSIFIIKLTKIISIFFNSCRCKKKNSDVELLKCQANIVRSVFWLFWVNEMQLKSRWIIKHLCYWYQKAAVGKDLLLKATSEYTYWVTSTILILTRKTEMCKCIHQKCGFVKVEKTHSDRFPDFFHSYSERAHDSGEPVRWL